MDEFSDMFEQTLDDIDQSNNTVVRHVNGRVDEIRESVAAAQNDTHMMEFAGMALAMPLAGLGMYMLGAPAAAVGLMGFAAPMYLLMFLENGGRRGERVSGGRAIRAKSGCRAREVHRGSGSGETHG